MTTPSPPPPPSSLPSTPPRHRLLLLGALASGAAFGYFLTSRPDPSHPYCHSFASGLGLAKAYTHLSPYLLPYVDPERGHRLAVSALSLSPLPRRLLGLTSSTPDPPALHQRVLGLSFPNPIGMAAGFDKGGECVDGILDMGFGWVEVGSVTPEPQAGNEKPRVFRLQEDYAVINRYGFNSDGVEKVRERLEKRRRARGKAVTTPVGGRGEVVGMNLGKNKTSPSALADYTRGLHALGEYADYVVINVSSPNTPGLRNLQQKTELHSLLSGLCKERDRVTAQTGRPLPLLVKIAPDLTFEDCEDIAGTVLSLPIDGLVISNTTLARPATLRSPPRWEAGGLSGRPLKEVSTVLIGEMYRRTGGRLAIIGVGGVESGDDVVEKMKAGASLVQMYSAFSYEGPCIASRVKEEILERMKKDGVAHVSQYIGLDAKAQEREMKTEARTSRMHP